MLFALCSVPLSIMITVESKYIGELRTECVHVRSGNELITDAPADNFGKGEAFSPTDLLATSLGTCILTTMAILTRNENLGLEGTTAAITKIMSDHPRKVAEVVVEIKFPENNFTDEQKKRLEHIAYNCPVYHSLHPDLKKTLIFNY